jgi:hypothetical protein
MILFKNHFVFADHTSTGYVVSGLGFLASLTAAFLASSAWRSNSFFSALRANWRATLYS